MSSRRWSLVPFMLLAIPIGRGSAQVLPTPGSVESLREGSRFANPPMAGGTTAACPPPIVWWGTPYPGGYDPWFRPIAYPPPVVLVPGAAPYPMGHPLPGPTRGGDVQRWPESLPPRDPAPRSAVLNQQPPPSSVRRGDPEKAGRLITIGDRLFRAENLRRASERYGQALAIAPQSAAPRVRLAQLALIRGQYGEAANLFREAQAAEPGWLINAPDIQSIYGEPADFAAPLSRLETHLQVQPNDRDGWLVLGAQWYLSGRTRRAADIFLRLSDRAADPTLTAFLAASSPSAAPDQP